MTITVNITGDADSPEIAQTLQALGVALQGEQKPFSGLKVETAPEPEPEEEKPVKRTRRKKKDTEPEATEEAEPKQEEEKPETNITLESIREKAVIILNSGKSSEFKALLDEFGYKSLSEAKKADYEALDAKISAI